MSFQIVSPIAMGINAESFKDAVKNFAKNYYNMNITQLIITDQYRYMRANLNYYKKSGKNRVGITMVPTTWNTTEIDGNIALTPNVWPYSPTVTYDTREYPATTFIDSSFIPRIVPLINPLPSIVSPMTPIIPTVIRY